MNPKVLFGLLLVFLFSAAPQSGRAQAATEYGLTAASGAGSISGAAKVFNQKLNGDRVASGVASRPTTVLHNTRLAGSKATSANALNGQSTPGTVPNSASNNAGASKQTETSGPTEVSGQGVSGQTGASGQHARGADPFGMTIVGAKLR